MPLPLFFIGVAATTGLFGAGKTVKAISDNSKANKINTLANKEVDEAREALEWNREEVASSLENLGELKMNILTNNVTNFVNTFEKIKNVDFTDSIGLDELNNLHIDKNTFKELKEMGNFALTVADGVTKGVASGALTAFGAYSAATTFASASTGTAISTLSGIAAKNATLAFFGGGSLASGGLGMAGGAMVLGGLVAGPALMIMGLVTGAKSQEKVNNALANKAESEEIVEALKTASLQCSAIRRRSYMFYNLLANMDAKFLPLIWGMERIIDNEGDDYQKYSKESKELIASAATTACTIKAILDTPLLTDDGQLTIESEEISNKVNKLIFVE